MDCFDSISRIILCRTIEPNHYMGNGDNTGNSDGEEKAIGHVWNPDRDNLGRVIPVLNTFKPFTFVQPHGLFGGLLFSLSFGSITSPGGYGGGTYRASVDAPKHLLIEFP